MVEMAIRPDNKTPQVVDAIEAVIGGLEKDWQDGI